MPNGEESIHGEQVIIQEKYNIISKQNNYSNLNLTKMQLRIPPDP